MDSAIAGMATEPDSEQDQTPADPEAPYGRKPDGTPYKRSPAHRAGLAAALARSRGVPAPPGNSR